jgi:predicted permease
MQRRILTGERLVAAFLCGCALFNYPLLSLFDRRVDLLGIPLIYLYVFAAWAGLIALMAWIIEGRAGGDHRAGHGD